MSGGGPPDDGGDGAAGATDARAFYDRQQPKLLTFVARRIGDAEQAQDVCQEAWKAYFVGLRRRGPWQKPVGVLFAIAKNKARDFCERRGRLPAPMEGEDLTTLAHCMETGSDGRHDADRRVDLEKALATLTQRQREALHLRFVDDLTVAEAAEMMGVTADGVKRLLRRALDRLNRTPCLDSYRPATPAERQEVGK
ncbi:sigma-70 family RNA polymerase sigma factor [Streptomyces sp. NPDC046465]|uniref:RNA polymerase sigma factor n=1 Tax=Streptomyces sp. NPDC046465 TaxID=3155810 RepID=UPI0033C5AC9B